MFNGEGRAGNWGEDRTQDVPYRMSKGDDGSSLSLAYRDLMELPRECIPKLMKVRHLDLSNNNFSYPHRLNQ